jgi:hypothetical protein
MQYLDIVAGCSTGFGYMVCAIAPNQLPEHRITQEILKACHCAYINSNNLKAYTYYPSFKSLVSAKKIWLPTVVHGAE